ncbi:peptidoglycan DD-metalloendopeptidase family protein [Candidatus Nomurabacteria bacterium]|nr:peptidoglycan DD-metalloendopeptidase family protein [Candidatus Nomurabacteria bacterium]
MKPYLAYKKQFKLIFLSLIFIFPLLFLNAQTAQELKDKIDQKNADIERLEQEIKAYQLELNELGQQKSSLSVSLKELDITRKKLNANISVLEDKIDTTNFKITGLSSQIGTKQESILNNTDAIAAGFRKINEFEQSGELEVILSESNFTEAWNDIDNMFTIREKVREHTIELRKVKSDLEDIKDETTIARNELLKLKSDLADQKKIVEQNVAAKNKLLSQTKNSESAYQKLLQDQLAKKVAIEKELQDYESQLKFILDPSKLPSAGVLSWPLDYVYVTQLFGRTVDATRLYASGSHSGTDFRASVGTPVKAMADGKVLGIGDTDVTCAGASFGKWVFIEYNNGLSSTYGHLSLIKAYKGQKVKRGDVVAYSGNTGHTTGPHLHVSVYVSSAAAVQTLPSKSCPGKTLTQPLAPTNAYLDPMYYLPPYN